MNKINPNLMCLEAGYSYIELPEGKFSSIEMYLYVFKENKIQTQKR